MKIKNLAILGSTGSIGTQALEVVDAFPEKFKVTVLSAQNNADLLIQQALKYNPLQVVIGSENLYKEVKGQLENTSIQVLTGAEALCDVVQLPEVDVVLTAMVGSAGLKPTVQAIKSGKDIALANKETLVVAGDRIIELVKKHNVNLLPVDSEHSAIFQCLVGEYKSSVEKLILTASGGPFLGKSRDFLRTIDRSQALKHPNWVMGQKITIDSATLMNKGLEVIEARWLFDLSVDQIDVVVHPQSIIHSMVQFVDGSIKAQMGLPDMKLPIQYALSYPERAGNKQERFSFDQFKTLTFERPDQQTFRNLALAYESLREGGNRPCVLNAANEIAVDAFLKEKISFLQISDVVEETLCQVPSQQNLNLDDYIALDAESKIVARDLVNRL